MWHEYERENVGYVLELLPDQEFIAWAYKEPFEYRKESHAAKRMARVHFRMLATGDAFELKRANGATPIVLDRETLCGWRIVRADGRSNAAWSLAANPMEARFAATASACERERDRPVYDRGPLTSAVVGLRCRTLRAVVGGDGNVRLEIVGRVVAKAPAKPNAALA